MKAILNYGAGCLQLQKVPVPQIKPGQVLLKILACAVCGGEYGLVKKPANAAPSKMGTIPGHEYAGEVVESSVKDFRKGMLVAVSPNTSCGFCRYCRQGVSYQCVNRAPRTVDIGGGYAEYSVVDASQCYEVPGNINAMEAAMSEPLACCLYASERVHIQPGERVFIAGAGANAQLFVQIARIKGASFIMVVDNMSERLELAKKLGADVVANPAEIDPLKAAEAVGGAADVVLVNRGKPEVFTEAIRWCDWRGRVLCYGVAPAGIAAAVEPNTLWRKEISLVGSRSYEGTFGAALSLIASGRIAVTPVIDRVVGLEGVIEALNNPMQQIKTVIVP